MKKLLLLSFATLLLGTGSLLKAQCYGNVNLDQSSNGFGASSFDISTTFSNELILISVDGYPGAFRGSVTVDGNPATFVNSVAHFSFFGNSGGSSVWAYEAPAVGLHPILIQEAGYWTFYNLNFASSFYASGSCTPLSLASISSSIADYVPNSSYSNSNVITTTAPNAMIYTDAEYNVGNADPFAISMSGATETETYHENIGIDATEATSIAATAGPYTITAFDGNASGSSFGGTLILVAIEPPPCGVTVTISSSTNPTCANNNGSITANVTGGTTPYTYSWTPSGRNECNCHRIKRGHLYDNCTR